MFKEKLKLKLTYKAIDIFVLLYVTFINTLRNKVFFLKRENFLFNKIKKFQRKNKMNKILYLTFMLSCLVHVAYMQCSNQNDSLCAIFGTQYCDGTSYLNGMLYSTYCAKLCNNCNCKLNLLKNSFYFRINFFFKLY